MFPTLAKWFLQKVWAYESICKGFKYHCITGALYHTVSHTIRYVVAQECTTNHISGVIHKLQERDAHMQPHLIAAIVGNTFME